MARITFKEALKQAVGIRPKDEFQQKGINPIKENEMLKDEELKPYHFIKQKNYGKGIRKYFNREFWADKKAAKKKDIVYQINMELMNGKHIEFLALEKDGGFYYKKKFYIFVDDYKYENITTGHWCFDYHEGFVLPFKRKFHAEQVIKDIEKRGITGIKSDDIPYATNPASIRMWLNSDIIQRLLAGAELNKWLQLLGIGIGVCLVFIIIHGFLTYTWTHDAIKAINANTQSMNQMIDFIKAILPKK